MSRVKDSFILDEGDSRPNATLETEQPSEFGDSIVDEVQKRQRSMNKKSFLAVFMMMFCTMFLIAYYAFCNL